jgi:hypothetical protein
MMWDNMMWDNMMWGSDYLHLSPRFPNRENPGGDDELAKIVGGNTARVCGSKLCDNECYHKPSPRGPTHGHS